jgi:hypothetical protein
MMYIMRRGYAVAVFALLVSGVTGCGAGGGVDGPLLTSGFGNGGGADAQVQGTVRLDGSVFAVGASGHPLSRGVAEGNAVAT